MTGKRTEEERRKKVVGGLGRRLQRKVPLMREHTLLAHLYEEFEKTFPDQDVINVVGNLNVDVLSDLLTGKTIVTEIRRGDR